MPPHQQATTCRRSGGPVSEHCTCEHCTLSMCEVCGAYEGGLTTDCPGTQVDFDRQREVYETPLDYTDERGWHQGAPMEHRSPRFMASPRPPAPPRIDPRMVVSPTIDWTTVDRVTGLQHELALRAIAWVLADRDCDDLSAALARAEDGGAAAPQDDTAPDALMRDLLDSLESAKIDFQRSCRLVEERDDAFRQAARQLVDAMETPLLIAPPVSRQLVTDPSSPPPEIQLVPHQSISSLETPPEIQLVRGILHAIGISQEALSSESRARAAEAARRWMTSHS